MSEWETSSKAEQWETSGGEWETSGSSKERGYAERVLKEGLPAVANFAQDIALSIPAGARGIADFISTTGKPREGIGNGQFGGGSFDEGMKAGDEGFKKSMETLQGAVPRFRDPRVAETQQSGMEGLMHGMDVAAGELTDLATDPTYALVPGRDQPANPEGFPAVHTAIEAATNYAPVPGLRALQKGVGKVPHVGSEWRAKRSADIKAAEDLLSKQADGEAEYSTWESWGEDRQKYMDALRDLDNTMIVYGKDLQAPQLGLGGRVARHEDQVGRREKGEFSSQMAMDEELRATAEKWEAELYKQKEAERLSPARFYTPERDLITPEPQPKPRLKGPEATLDESQVIADETRKLMKDRNGSLSKNEIDKADPDILEKRSNLHAEESDRLLNEDPKRNKEKALEHSKKAWDLWDRAQKIRQSKKIADEVAAKMNRGTELPPTTPDAVAEYGPFNPDYYSRLTPEQQLQFRDHPKVHNFIYKEASELDLIDDMGRVTNLKEFYKVADQVLDKIKNDPIILKEVFGSKFLQTKLDAAGYVRGDRHNPNFNKTLFDIQSRPVDALQGKTSPTVREQLQSIRKESTIPYYKVLAELFLDDKSYNPKFAASRHPRDDLKTSMGVFDEGQYKIYQNPEFLGDEAVFLHENVHGYTSTAINLIARIDKERLTNPGAYPGDKIQTSAGKTISVSHLRLPVEKLNRLYLSFKQIHEERVLAGQAKPDVYGLVNTKEFASEGMTNPEFQATLAKTKYTGKPGWRTYWDAFVGRIGQLLGFKESDHTYLSELIRTTTDIIRGSGSEVRTAFLNESSSLYGIYRFGDYLKDLKEQGVNIPEDVARAMYEEKFSDTPRASAHPDEPAVKVAKNIPGLKKIQQQYADKRTWEEVLPEIQKTPDVSMSHANIVAKMIHGKFTATDHPLWSWTSSQIHQLKNAALQRANEKLHGKDRKNPSPGTYNHQWKLLTAVEREEVNRVGWHFNNEEAAASPSAIQRAAREALGHDLTERQVKAYQDRVKVNKEVLGDINQLLAAEGKHPIHELPNYWSPNEFTGPFLVKFIDPKTGETSKISSSYLKPNLKKMQEAAPDHKLELIERGLKGELDFDQLTWILRQLHKEMRDPAAKAIAEGLRRQGFSRHGLARKMVAGGEGSGTGRKALREYEETSEKYIRSAYEYISNRELDKLYNKVLDEKSIDNKPYAKGFALESIDTGRGGANATFEGLSRLLGDVVSGAVQIGTAGTIKLPQRFLKDAFRTSNKIGTTLLLGFGNLTNLAAQMLQAPTYMPPKLLAMGADSGLNSFQTGAATIKAMAKTLHELPKWDSSADIRRLKEIGALDPTFKYDWSTYASDSDPRYRSTMAEHLTGISLLGYVEANAVRRPAALMFLNMLRELGYEAIAKDKGEIYQVAKEMTDQYMVSTKWYEKPHMFSRSGTIGTALSPLQSFTTTWAGMFREYSKLSASGLLEGSVAKQLPLASFMAMNLVTAGMLGLVGVKEWDAVANWLNDKFGYNIPTGTEFIMSKVKSTKLRFGLLSDALGMHIGATFNAPTLTGSMGIGAQKMYDAGNFAVQAGKEIGSQMGFGSGPTSVEKRDALKGVMPRFSPVPGANWGDIEQAYTPPGLPYQDSAGNAGPVTRDEDDQLARRLGTYSVKEAEEKSQNYTMKKNAEQRSQRLSKAMDKAIDLLLSDPSNGMEKIEPIFQKLEADAFSGQDIKDGLKRELLSKMLESDLKQLGKSGSSSKQMQMRQLYEQLR